MQRYSCFLLFVVPALMFPITATAVDHIPFFELDGNGIEESSVFGDEDWDDLYADGANTGGDAIVFTGIKADPAPNSIFEGGNKDIHDINHWSWKHGSVPDKDDITNAYAAAYQCEEHVHGDHHECDPGDTIAYFGADRFSNAGDAFLGFWFFKDDVGPNEDGSFHGQHSLGDVLVLVNFPQANNATPEIRAIVWDPSCAKADNAPEGDDYCVARNLKLKYEGVVCGTTAADHACAMTNGGPKNAPWPYSAKDPQAGCSEPPCFPYESFFEGGINLTELLNGFGDTCFATFMAESRSSKQFTATLKDFVFGKFPLCAVELSKACGTGRFDPSTGMLKVPFTVTLENTGVASVDLVNVFDDYCGSGSWTEMTIDSGTWPLAAGVSVSVTDFCYINPVDFDPEIDLMNGAYAIAEGGIVPVQLGDCTTFEGDPDTCYDLCDYDLSPSIEVTKDCSTTLDDSTGEVRVKVGFTGTVKNTSNLPQCVDDQCVFPPGQTCTVNADCDVAPVPLLNISVSDNKAAAEDIMWTDGTWNNPVPAPEILIPGEMAYFKGEYIPSETNSPCASEARFADTVTANAEDAFTGDPVSDQAPAECDLCTDDCPIVD